MNSKKHIVLLGAGAVGVLPASKLLKLPEVRLTAAADAGRVARYRREGLYLNGRRLDFDYAAPEEMGAMPPADLVIAATKNPDLPTALENVVPLVAEKTVFLPLLNGITAKKVKADFAFLFYFVHKNQHCFSADLIFLKVVLTYNSHIELKIKPNLLEKVIKWVKKSFCWPLSQDSLRLPFSPGSGTRNP